MSKVSFQVRLITGQESSKPILLQGEIIGKNLEHDSILIRVDHSTLSEYPNWRDNIWNYNKYEDYFEIDPYFIKSPKL